LALSNYECAYNNYLSGNSRVPVL